MGKATGGGRSAGGAGGGSKGRPGGGAGRPGAGAGGRSGGDSGAGRGGREGAASRPGSANRGPGASRASGGAPRDRQEERRRWSRAHHRHYHNELSYHGDGDFRPRRSNTQTFFVLAVFGLILLGLLWLVLLVFF
ncbi:hypothetical protein [Nocardiopsis sp. YSL2]|uniref:hypothetical protein n=1 Tax=Nocardiopsis sp. YSL2 TaxID=2939492 RepID=UPI0026F412C1|nr:hypothetical protein [Nocardiopsis sp. YSL2]